MAKKVKKCPYGYESDPDVEDSELPCELDPDNFDCVACNLSECVTVLREIQEDGINFNLILPEGYKQGVVENGTGVTRKRRKAKTQ